MTGVPLSMSGTLPSLSGTPPSIRYPTCVWYPTTLLEPHPCLEPYLMSGIPPQGPMATILPAVPYPTLAIAAAIWHLTALYPLIWPLPAHHLEILLHATPNTPSNCHLALMHPDISPPSCLALLPPAIPSHPHYLVLLAPTPCPIWLPAIAPPAPLPQSQSGPPAHTPQNIITKGPFHPKGNLSFSKFPSFPMFVSISHHVGSISSCLKIISFTLFGKIPKIVMK